MHLDVLGCSGGIGKGQKTTCMLINDEWLIDAGTGVEQLTHEQMKALKGVFLTHAHMDHICCLPMLLPIVNYSRPEPFRIFARAEIIEALQKHIFNEFFWTDFTKIPTPETSRIEFCVLAANTPLSFDELSVTGIPVSHPTPAYGYLLSSAESSIAFTGDCHDSPDFWKTLSQATGLKTVLVDLSFPESYRAVADISGHYTPSGLQKDLADWPQNQPKPVIGISHLKPGFEEEVLAETELCLGKEWPLRTLAMGDRFTF